MPRPKGSKNVAKGKRPHDDVDENPTERKSSRRSASTLSTAESPKKSAKISPKKQNTDSKELLEDNFEDEMEGIQQFLNETSEKSPDHQGDVIDDEFEPAAENIPSNDVATTNVSKPPTKNLVKKEIIPSPIPPPHVAVKSFPQLVVSDKATEGRCGRCEGCSRTACRECSACKRQEYNDCIDLYCTNQKSGLSERAAIRELYLKALKKQTDETNKQVEVEEEDESSEEEELESDEEADEVVQMKVDQMMSMVTKDKSAKATKEPKTSTTKASPAAMAGGPPSKKAQPNFNVVYGGSSKAAKLRRCGECEGCTRDDCGSCQACADKPRFGGKGTKKKACTERYCRLKAGKVA